MPVFCLPLAVDYPGAHAPREALRMRRPEPLTRSRPCARAMRAVCHAGQRRRALPDEPGFFPGGQAAAGLFLNGVAGFAASAVPPAPGKAQAGQRP